jgi:carotenoid cleavage dioxygenase-like enzyme
LSLNVTIDPIQKVVLVTITGEIKDADLIEIPAATKAHPQFDPSFSEIVDFSGVTSGNVSTFAVQTLAQRASIYKRASKHVVVAPQAHGFGLTRMYQVYARETRPNMDVVRTREEAYKCLGLDSKTIDPR